LLLLLLLHENQRTVDDPDTSVGDICYREIILWFQPDVAQDRERVADGGETGPQSLVWT